ncbi:UPF0149 family protein [Bowmanella dokdonensis]|uniref:UPF0149 family protein n=1 Tax=Bowmanella dokdonensis TaxID=751969 RepID=A0A939DJG3_9ALTE|nr:UPF0149 family protein [Bowmanella dokdonensis]MBN7823849.1 UPF0149 family protein [Bowmanella dokdonensis]
MTGKSEPCLNNLQTLCDQYCELLRAPCEIQGLIFAVAAAPEIPPPQIWMGWVVIEPDRIDQNLADSLTGLLMDCFKLQLQAMRDEQLALPPNCRYHGGLTLDEPMSQWFSGCLLAHQHLQDRWQKAWQAMQRQKPDRAPEAAKDLSHLLRLFSTFANIPLALEQAVERGNPELEHQLPAIAETLPRALKQYVDLAGELAAYLPNQFETFTS